MNCHYCNKTCLRINPDQHRWNCVPCKVYYSDASISIIGRVNGHSYFFLIKNGHYKIPALLVKGLPTSHSNKVVLNLTTRPDITPSNVNEKLKTYLTFS